MMEIQSYMNDGANYQAQAVLVLLRRKVESIMSSEKLLAIFEVGRWENCREQGYVFSINVGFARCKNYCVYEHRNSDNLCVQMFEGHSINTPSVDDVFRNKKDKWDIDKTFPCEQVVECADFIIADMKNVYREQLEIENLKQES